MIDIDAKVNMTFDIGAPSLSVTPYATIEVTAVPAIAIGAVPPSTPLRASVTTPVTVRTA